MTTKRLTLRGDMGQLEKLRLFVDSAADVYELNERARYRLQLVCEELVTNIISYGYDGATRQRAEIEVCLSQGPGCTEVCLTDNGVPFNPLTLPEPDLTASIEERRIGGLGIHFARTLAETIAYERREERNRLEMTLRTQHQKEDVAE